jgi:hypothetical protein
MSQEASDLPRSVQIIGQYKALVGLVAVLGLLAGIVFAALNPPGSSKALVLFTAPSCPAAGSICGGPMFSPDYIQAKVLKAYPDGVQIKPVTDDVLAISATGGTVAQAEATAEAAVRSYIADAGSLSYLGEQPSALVLEQPTPARGTTPPKQLLGDALLGAIFGALVGVIAALAAGQTIIDPPTITPGYGSGGQAGGAPAQVPLLQLAREYAERTAALKAGRGDASDLS